KLGNLAVHSSRTIAHGDSLAAVQELFHVCYWLAFTYGQTGRPLAGLTFDAAQVPKVPVPKQAMAVIRQLQAQLKEQQEKFESFQAQQLKALAVDQLTGQAL